MWDRERQERVPIKRRCEHRGKGYVTFQGERGMATELFRGILHRRKGLKAVLASIRKQREGLQCCVHRNFWLDKKDAGFDTK